MTTSTRSWTLRQPPTPEVAARHHLAEALLAATNREYKPIGVWLEDVNHLRACTHNLEALLTDGADEAARGRARDELSQAMARVMPLYHRAQVLQALAILRERVSESA